eukprot:6189266-Pleurochrysis_carterae.AAC.3
MHQQRPYGHRLARLIQAISQAEVAAPLVAALLSQCGAARAGLPFILHHDDSAALPRALVARRLRLHLINSRIFWTTACVEIVS